MSKKKNSSYTNSKEQPKIIEEDGMRISYDKSEIEDYFPHLMDELENKSANIKIDGIRHNQKENENQKQDNKEETTQKKISLPKELTNPGAVDFIRRCSKAKEALEILEYLRKRKELSQKDYEVLKQKCSNDAKLEIFVEKSGGYKKPGYYEKKYFSKQLKS